MNDDRFSCTAVPLRFLPSSKPNAPTRATRGNQNYIFGSLLRLVLLLSRKRVVESKIVSDLFLVQGDLTGTVADIKDRRSTFGLDSDFTLHVRC